MLWQVDQSSYVSRKRRGEMVSDDFNIVHRNVPRVKLVKSRGRKTGTSAAYGVAVGLVIVKCDLLGIPIFRTSPLEFQRVHTGKLEVRSVTYLFELHMYIVYRANNGSRCAEVWRVAEQQIGESGHIDGEDFYDSLGLSAPGTAAAVRASEVRAVMKLSLREGRLICLLLSCLCRDS